MKITVSDSTSRFLGQVNINKKYLKNFTPNELREFNALVKKAENTDDKRLITSWVGATLKNDLNGDTFRYSTIGLSLEEKGKPVNYQFSKEYYEIFNTKSAEKLRDDGAFARAILNPLRKLYG